MRRARSACAAVALMTAAAALVPAAAVSGGRFGRSSIVALNPPANAAGSQPAPVNGRLSNERTLSRWAHSVRSAPIYAQPNAHSSQVAQLHLWTEDGFPEVYLLLAAKRDASGTEWTEVRIPMRPNGRVGWVVRSALSDFHVTHKQLVLNRSRLRIYLFDNGRLLWSAPVGIGKPSTPTPPGYFWLREGFKITDRSSGYWPYAFGTADYSTLTDWPGGGVVGIHGPYGDPSLIPGRPSHGCIRMHTGDDAWIAAHVSIGTPLRII